MRILDPDWKEIDPDPDPDYFFKIYWIFLTKQNFQICFLICFAYFYDIILIILDWIIQKSGKFYNLSFFNSTDFGFKSKLFSLQFLLIFCPLGPDPWIRIFLRIRILKAKILQIQWIRIQILSTVKWKCTWKVVINITVKL